MKKYSLFFFFIGILVIVVLISTRNIKRIKGFTLKKITSSHPYDTNLAAEKFCDTDIFDQPYYYLGSGTKCYAFVSRDQNYVIKFFKQNHMRDKIPFSVFSQKKNNESKHFRERFYTSVQIAYEYLPKETGLIYLHLTKSKHIKKMITFFDKQGERHKIALDEMEFLVQRKTDSVFPTIEKWMNHGEENMAKEALSNLLQIIKRRCDRGLLDYDVNCRKNIGFIGSQAVEIDIGEFRFAPENHVLNIEQEMRNSTTDLSDWLKASYPSLYEFLQSELQSYHAI